MNSFLFPGPFEIKYTFIQPPQAAKYLKILRDRTSVSFMVATPLHQPSHKSILHFEIDGLQLHQRCDMV